MPLTKTTPTDVIIKDFENSDNPKFAGKSKEKRKEMAIAASYTVKESVELDESRRIVSKHESGNRKAVVYKDPESDEHQVEFYHNGAHQKDATYFTSGDKEGKDDATGTAKAYINKANIYQKESVETLTQALMSEDKEAIKEAFAAAISQKIRAKLHEMKSEMFEELSEAKKDLTYSDDRGFDIHPKNKNDISDHDVNGNPIVRFSVLGGRKKSIQVPYSFRSSDTHGSPSELHSNHPIANLVAQHLGKHSEVKEDVCDTKPAKTRAELNAAKDALEDKRQAKKDDPYAEVKEPKSK